ncbi:ribonuclease H-like protein, partial [Cubamyces sp. BRFM 1775]
RNVSERVPGDVQTNQAGEVYAVIMVHRLVAPFVTLHVVSDSRYVVDGLTKWLPNWERDGWLDVGNAELLRELVALLRTRTAATTFRWVKGHAGDRGNEGADRLAKAGAQLPRPFLPAHLPAPEHFVKRGIELASLTQRLAYRAIMRLQTSTVTPATLGRVRDVLAEVRDWNGHELPPDALWTALRADPVEPKVRDFLWKALHCAYRLGDFWSAIPGHGDRARCRRCGVVEDMTHILTVCTAPGQHDLWLSARRILRKARVYLPRRPTLGLYLGAPLLVAKDGHGNVRSGTTRLLRIILSETAYVAWTLRCERVIGWQDMPERVHSAQTVLNRWHNALNKRLWLDQQRARRALPGRRLLPCSVVEGTWETVLDAESDLNDDWVRHMGVLVGRRG